MTHLEHQNKRGWLERMLTWDSGSSFWIDMIFGVLPAIFSIIYSLVFVFLSAALGFKNNTGTELPNYLWYAFSFVMGSLGLISSLSLLYSSFARSRTKQKKWVISGLIALIGLSSIVIVGSLFSAIEIRPTGSAPLLIISVTAMALTAIKHIVLLTRVRGQA